MRYPTTRWKNNFFANDYDQAKKTDLSKGSSGSSLFKEATEKWEDTYPRKIVTQALKIGSFVSICYPYKFAYCLMKLGYIPRSIAEYATVDNERLLRVPSIREYMNYMKNDEGDWLWMRGEISFCSTYVLYNVVEKCVKDFLMKNSKPKKSLREEYLECFYVTSRSVFVAVVVTQPFIILSYRQIGQYVGKEDIYSTATGFVSVLTKPGILSLLRGILLRYVLYVIPTICGKFAGHTWDNWLAARISCLPQPKKFLKATEKGTYFEWLRPTLEWCIEVTVDYWVAVAFSPLEIAFITSCVCDSGIKVGHEPFVPPGGFFQRFITMWRDGKLFRSSSYYRSRFIQNMDAFVVL